jgi:hypothetical protein
MASHRPFSLGNEESTPLAEERAAIHVRRLFCELP